MQATFNKKLELLIRASLIIMRGAQTQSESHIYQEIEAFDTRFCDYNEGCTNPKCKPH
jgi:hypothetical protein